MNRLRNLFGIFAFSMLLLSLPTIASAQWRNDRDNDDDDVYSRNDNSRNNRNNRNGDYRNSRNGGYNGDLQSTIKNLKNGSKRFERQLDRELDNSRYDGGDREDRINQIAKDFADAAKDLDDRYDNRGNYNTGDNEAQRVLQLGNQLDREISRARLNGSIQSDWDNIRYDLDTLANAYNDNNTNNNRNNRSNRRNRQSNGDWRSRIPFPLPF